MYGCAYHSSRGRSRTEAEADTQSTGRSECRSVPLGWHGVMYVVLSQKKFLLITCKYALKLELYFHQNEAPIPGQFHATEKRHFL